MRNEENEATSLKSLNSPEWKINWSTFLVQPLCCSYPDPFPQFVDKIMFLLPRNLAEYS